MKYRIVEWDNKDPSDPIKRMELGLKAEKKQAISTQEQTERPVNEGIITKSPRTKSPRSKSPGQNPPGQNPPKDKIPPRTKSPQDKIPLDKIAQYILYFIDSNIFY